MSIKGPTDQTIRNYLLQQATPLEEEALEVRLLIDKELSERIRMIEDELIEDYAFGLLSPAERERFHTHFVLTPERRLSLRFAQAMYHYVRRNASIG